MACNMGKIYVVGMGPGRAEGMSLEAVSALRASDIIVGYKVYIDLLREDYGPIWGASIIMLFAYWEACLYDSYCCRFGSKQCQISFY